MALSTDEENKVREIIEAFTNGKRLSDLPDRLRNDFNINGSINACVFCRDDVYFAYADTVHGQKTVRGNGNRFVIAQEKDIVTRSRRG